VGGHLRTASLSCSDAAMEVVDKDVVDLGELCKGWDRANSPYYLRRQWSVL